MPARLGGNLFPASSTFALAGGAVATAGTYSFRLPYGTTLSSLDFRAGTGTGSFTLGITINGVAVTGLSNLTVNSSTTASVVSTANNVVAAAGGDVAFVVSNVTGTITGSIAILNWLRP